MRTAPLASRGAATALARAAGHVNIGANAANRPASHSAYAASKSGVARLTETMAEEFKDRGITVNAILPSILDTPANRADMPGRPSRW